MGKYDSIKKDLYKFVNNNPLKTKFEIANHLIQLGYAKASVYRWIRCVENHKPLERKKGSRRVSKIASKANIRYIKNKFNHRSGCSQRKVARRLGCSQRYIGMILKKHTKIKCYKKPKKPNLSEQQKKVARPKCRRMIEKYGNTDFIIDDESYFTLTHSAQPGNDCFYSDDINATADRVKYNFHAKFEQKVLVYLCIAPKGICTPYFVPSGLAINQQVYLDNCIKKHLVPFINKYYPKGGYVFWPDLAKAHYAKSVLEYLKTNNINFVQKVDNPANVPKARPIEDFWGNLKQIVYEGDWTAKTLDQLETRIRSCLKKIDQSLVQRHAASVRQRLDRIRRYGVYA